MTDYFDFLGSIAFLCLSKDKSEVFDALSMLFQL